MVSLMQRPSNPFYYMLWVSILSTPFYLIGELGFNFLPVGLPVSAFMAVCPALAIGIYRSKKELWEIGVEAFQWKHLTIRSVLLAILIIPAILILKYYAMNYTGAALPIPRISIAHAGVLALLFFVAATVEEIGWTGYLTREFLKTHHFLVTGAIIGLFTAIWHIIPYFQMGREPEWILWQCIGSVLKRVLMVWLYLKSNRSVLVTILFHTSSNLSVFAFPIMGSHYDPLYFCAIFLALIGVIYALIQSIRFARRVKQILCPAD